MNSIIFTQLHIIPTQNLHYILHIALETRVAVSVIENVLQHV